MDDQTWEIFLLKNQPNEKFEQYYTKRLKDNKNGYWETLAEAETAYLMDFKFKIPVLYFGKKTVGNKDVDLIAKLGNDEIFIEVKTSRYKSDKNSDIQQESKLLRALKNSSNKFLATNINLLVFYDEQKYSIFYDPSFMGNDVPKTYLNAPFFEYPEGKIIDMQKISALLLFGQRNLIDNSRNCIIYKNPNAYKSLDMELVACMTRSCLVK